jgi:hypothetical protein
MLFAFIYEEGDVTPKFIEEDGMLFLGGLVLPILNGVADLLTGF